MDFINLVLMSSAHPDTIQVREGRVCATFRPASPPRSVEATVRLVADGIAKHLVSEIWNETGLPKKDAESVGYLTGLGMLIAGLRNASKAERLKPVLLREIASVIYDADERANYEIARRWMQAIGDCVRKTDRVPGWQMCQELAVRVCERYEGIAPKKPRPEKKPSLKTAVMQPNAPIPKPEMPWDIAREELRKSTNVCLAAERLILRLREARKMDDRAKQLVLHVIEQEVLYLFVHQAVSQTADRDVEETAICAADRASRWFGDALYRGRSRSQTNALSRNAQATAA